MSRSNAWNVTEAEYREALKRERDDRTSPNDKADYWQLVRFYRGEIFIRDAAERAAKLIRYGEQVT